MLTGSYLNIKSAGANVLMAVDAGDSSRDDSDFASSASDIAFQDDVKIEILGFQWKSKLVEVEEKPPQAPMHVPEHIHDHIQPVDVLPQHSVADPKLRNQYGMFWVFKAVDRNSPILYDLAYQTKKNLLVTLYMAPNPVGTKRGLLTIGFGMAIIARVETYGDADFEKIEGMADTFLAWVAGEPGRMFERVGFTFKTVHWSWKEGQMFTKADLNTMPKPTH